MPEVVTGCPGATPQRSERIFTAGSGWSRIDIWQGSQNQINSILTWLIYNYDEVRERQLGGNVIEVEARLNDAEGGTVEVPTVRWEFLASPASRSIMQHPVSNGLTGCDVFHLQGLSSGTFGDCPQNVMAPDPDSFKSDLDQQLGVKLSSDAANKLRDYILLGSQSYTFFSPWIRKTSVVSSRYGQQTALDNVGSIILQEDIRSLEGIPSNFVFAPPTTDDDGVRNQKIKDSLQAGWLKHHPHITRTQSNKFDIVQDWEWGHWQTHCDALIYPIYNNPCP